MDWKGKHGSTWLVNERAVKSYEKWSTEFKLPLVVAFFVIDKERKILKRKFAVLNIHSHKLSTNKQWDKNRTVEFEKDIPDFTKANLLKYI